MTGEEYWETEKKKFAKLDAPTIEVIRLAVIEAYDRSLDNGYDTGYDNARDIYYKMIDQFSTIDYNYISTGEATMTFEEYQKKLTDTVKRLPTAFQDYVGQEAYDRVHSGGYEECLNIANEMVLDLAKVLEKYNESLGIK
jgi:hypothetical protein